MSISRRNLLKMSAAIAAIPLTAERSNAAAAEKGFASGSPELGKELGGGIRADSVVVVVGPRGSGKTAFFLRMAKANGIRDVYPMGAGTSDMLSIVTREDRTHVGSVMLDAAEPAAEQERTQMARDAAARDAFLSRWFQRTREVMRRSGGLMAISLCEASAGGPQGWVEIPDYVIRVSQGTCSIVRRP
jgi:hypothetical protein